MKDSAQSRITTVLTMLRIYHNPRCSKSREALAILEGSGREFEVVKYLQEPPGEDMLRRLVEKLDAPAAELLRRNESEFKTLGLARKDEISDEEAIQALLTQPKLLQRPILETEDRTVIGRPPERIQELINS